MRRQGSKDLLEGWTGGNVDFDRIAKLVFIGGLT